jgi:hypothetical protein
MGDLASLVRTGRVPLMLYGLREDFAGARTVAGVGWHNDVVNLVSLGHGDRVDASAAWVQVTVCGPLHGHGDRDAASRTWSIDPLPMIAGELLGLAGIDVRTSAEKAEVEEALLSRGFGEAQLRLAGEPETFRTLRCGDCWLALCDLEPDHLLYIVARNVAASDLELVRIDDVDGYAQQ